MCNNTLDMAPCVISVCRTRALIPKIADGSHPINLSKKNIIIICQLADDKCCSQDAPGLFNFFYGYNVVVTFHNVMFVIGYSSGSGRALNIVGDW